MKRTKKSVSALIVALCMLVQLIPAFPVQMAEAADTADIVLDFYNGTGFTVADDSLASLGKYTRTDYETGDPINVLEGNIKEKPYIVEFDVKQTGYYDYNPYIYARTLRGSVVEFTVETPKEPNSEKKDSILCQTVTMSRNANQDDFYIRINDTFSGKVNYNGTEYQRLMTVTNNLTNNRIYLVEGKNRFIAKAVGDASESYGDGWYGFSSVEFTKVNVQPADFVIDFTKKPTDGAYKNATLDAHGWRLNSSMYEADGTTLKTGIATHGSTHLRNGWAYMNFTKWNEVLALDIRVPATGEYDITLNAPKLTAGYGATVLFSIGDKRLSAVNAEVENGDILLGGLNLTEGIHILKLECVGNVNLLTSSKSFGMNKLSFKSVNKATAFTEAVITSQMGATAAEATVANQGWAINKDLTESYLYDMFENDTCQASDVITDRSDALRYSGIYVQFNNSDEDFGDTLAIDVNVPEAGTYNVSALFNEGNNFGGAFDLYVGNTYLGRVYNDPNEAYTDKYTLKGFKNVTLTAGTNTFKFVRNASDMIGAGSRAYFGLQSITLTPETGSEAQEITLTAPDSINVGETADVTAVMNYADGRTDGAVVEVSAWEAYYGVNGAPVHGNQEEAAAATLSGGKLTGNKAGRLTLEARATVDGKLYTAQKHVYVNAAPATVDVPESDPNFGTAYAYVEEYKEDTYKVTFIGGVDKTEGYAKIGYEIQVEDGEVAYVESENVYEKITVNGTSHTAAEYGGSHIFIGTQGGIKAESTVTAKPYVKVPDGNGGYTTIYHGEVELTLNF